MGEFYQLDSSSCRAQRRPDEAGLHSVPRSGFTVEGMTKNPMAIQPADDWVPEACTLPTAEQPLRRADFDDLFARDGVAVVRESPTRTRIDLGADPETAARAAALAVEESGCCSFFAFDIAIRDGEVVLGVATAPAQREVLAALTARAESRVGAGT